MKKVLFSIAAILLIAAACTKDATTKQVNASSQDQSILDGPTVTYDTAANCFDGNAYHVTFTIQNVRKRDSIVGGMTTHNSGELGRVPLKSKSDTLKSTYTYSISTTEPGAYPFLVIYTRIRGKLLTTIPIGSQINKSCK